LIGILVARLREHWEESMTIVAILFAVGAYLELYVALGERNPWGALCVGLVLAFLSNVAARRAVAKAAAVSAIANGTQHSTGRAIGPWIARSLSVFAPASSAT
jgi:hypothetical protein